MVGESGLFTPADIVYVQESGVKAVSNHTYLNCIAQLKIPCEILFACCYTSLPSKSMMRRLTLDKGRLKLTSSLSVFGCFYWCMKWVKGGNFGSKNMFIWTMGRWYGCFMYGLLFENNVIKTTTYINTCQPDNILSNGTIHVWWITGYPIEVISNFFSFTMPEDGVVL